MTAHARLTLDSVCVPSPVPHRLPHLLGASFLHPVLLPFSSHTLSLLVIYRNSGFGFLCRTTRERRSDQRAALRRQPVGSHNVLGWKHVESSPHPKDVVSVREKSVSLKSE